MHEGGVSNRCVDANIVRVLGHSSIVVLGNW